jgi:hypothetical protein
MNRERKKQRLKLWLLALVLALVLTWYTLHPAPSPVHRKERENTPPDAERRRTPYPTDALLLASSAQPAFWPAAANATFATEDLSAWPEYLEIN